MLSTRLALVSASAGAVAQRIQSHRAAAVRPAQALLAAGSRLSTAAMSSGITGSGQFFIGSQISSAVGEVTPDGALIQWLPSPFGSKGAVKAVPSNVPETITMPREGSSALASAGRTATWPLPFGAGTRRTIARTSVL